jgi:GH24 family phage-related lysozyme (muramidase)
MNREKAIQIAIAHAKKWELLCCREQYRSGVRNKYFSSPDTLPKDTKVWSYPDGRGYSVGWGSYNKLSDNTPVTSTTFVTKEVADREIELEMRRIDRELFPKIRVPLTETQYAALMDTAYNAGLGSLDYTSNRRGDTFPSLLTTVNSGGDTTSIFPKVAISDSGSGNILTNLVNRRKDAAKLYTGGYNSLYQNLITAITGGSKAVNLAVIGGVLVGLSAYGYYLYKKGKLKWLK